MEGQIRPFVENDIPQVAALHNKIWHVEPSLSHELMREYRDYFGNVFLRQPWSDSRFCSLVHEEADGRITGFMGSMPRKMKLNGSTLQMRIASQFFVDPASRGFAGIQLARSFMEGPQDLSFTDEANASARLIWERLGAELCTFSSLRWIAVLRPTRFGLIASQKYGFPRTVAGLMAPVARLMDSVLARVPKNPLKPVPPRFKGSELDCASLAACLAEAAKTDVLSADYDPSTVDWLMHRATQLQRSGKLQKVLVRTRSGNIAGWYLYYLNPGGLSDVVQLFAKDSFAQEVVDHLFYHAWQRGASVLIGRPDPRFMRALSERYCMFYSSRRQWTLVHSRHPDLAEAFVRGEAIFSRLEGEWCLHFR